MSPEQALGQDLDHRSDIFSVGVVLYELATGRRPFTGSTFAEIADKILHAQPAAIVHLNYVVRPELERITLKCLQKQPDRRYQSARELMVDLQTVRRALDTGQDGFGLDKSVSATGPYYPPPPETELSDPKVLAQSDVVITYAKLDDQPFPLTASELVAVVQSCLAKAVIAIHFVGEYFGLVPEATDLSMVALQNQVGARYCDNSSLKRLIWMPKGLQPRDERQTSFIR